MKKRSAFTLLELIIVMVILSILFVLLLNTYNRIGTMVFRVQQEKEVSQEVLQISQIIQNFAERNIIDYAKYRTGLIDSKGLTDILYLTGQDGAISFFTSGTTCIDPTVEYVFTGAGSDCSFRMASSTTTKELINTHKIIISRVVFKIIPFASDEQYLSSDGLCATGNYLHCLNDPGFRMIFTAYSTNYGKQRATHIAIPFQQFF